MQAGYVRSAIDLTWANFWTTSIAVRRDLPQTSVSLTRGGPLMGRGPGVTAAVSLGNRAGAQTRWTVTSQLARNDDGYRQRRVSTLLSVRPAPRWQLSAEPYYEKLTEPQQYVSTLAGGRPETFGSRYVFAFIDRSTVATQFRLGLTVKPDMNLDVYAEPFAASGRYYDYGELAAPKSRERLLYGTNGTTMTVHPDGSRTVGVDGTTLSLRNRDFNTLSFRSNVVLRWEWRPGSTLFVVWQQSRAGTEVRGDYVGPSRHVPLARRDRHELLRRQDVDLAARALKRMLGSDPAFQRSLRRVRRTCLRTRGSGRRSCRATCRRPGRACWSRPRRAAARRRRPRPPRPGRGRRAHGRPRAAAHRLPRAPTGSTTPAGSASRSTHR